MRAYCLLSLVIVPGLNFGLVWRSPCTHFVNSWGRSGGNSRGSVLRARDWRFSLYPDMTLQITAKLCGKIHCQRLVNAERPVRATKQRVLLTTRIYLASSSIAFSTVFCKLTAAVPKFSMNSS